MTSKRSQIWVCSLVVAGFFASTAAGQISDYFANYGALQNAFNPVTLRVYVTGGGQLPANLFNSLAGQTFTGYSNLYSLGFAVNVQDSAVFTTYVMEWNSSENHPQGSILWSGQSSLVYESSAMRQMGEIVDYAGFSVGDLTLDPAKTYIAFMSATSGGSSATVYGTSSPGKTYDGGAAFIASTNPGPSGFTTSNWSQSSWQDTVFGMSFSASTMSPVPEPSAYAVLGSLLCGAVFVWRRRSRRAGRDKNPV